MRLTRGEFDDMLRPAIGETVAATRRVLDSAGVEPGDLSAIVLVGGSSRIPLVSEMLSAAFGRPLALDNHPKHDVALGAAIRGTPAAQPPAPAPARRHAAGGRGSRRRRRCRCRVCAGSGCRTGPASGPGARRRVRAPRRPHAVPPGSRAAAADAPAGALARLAARPPSSAR